jgi:hypothetical protein
MITSSEVKFPFSVKKSIVSEGLTTDEYIQLRNLFKDKDIHFTHRIDTNSYLNIQVLKIIEILKLLEKDNDHNEGAYVELLKNKYHSETIKENGFEIEYNYNDCSTFSFTFYDYLQKNHSVDYIQRIQNILEEIGRAYNKDDWNESINTELIKSCIFEWVIYRLCLGVNPSKKLIREFLKSVNKSKSPSEKIPDSYINYVVKNYERVISFDNFKVFEYFSEIW